MLSCSAASSISIPTPNRTSEPSSSTTPSTLTLPLTTTSPSTLTVPCPPPLSNPLPQSSSAAPFLANGHRPIKKPPPYRPLLPFPPHFPPFKHSYHPLSFPLLQFLTNLINCPLHTPKALLPTPKNKSSQGTTPPNSTLIPVESFLYQIPASTIYSKPLPTPLHPLFNNQSSLNHSPKQHSTPPNIYPIPNFNQPVAVATYISPPPQTII